MPILRRRSPRAIWRRTSRLTLIAALLACCTVPPATDVRPPAPTGATTAAATVTQTASAPATFDALSRWAAPPEQIDPTRRFLFYLHGKIIEDQGLPAVSPRFGVYQYEEILQALEESGFVVVSEVRSRDTDAVEYAERVAAQLTELMRLGVPPASLTVVGASKGAAIAVLVSSSLKDPGVNYVLLGTCAPDTVAGWTAQGIALTGNVLALRDEADEYGGTCDGLFAASDGKGLGRHAEIVVHVGTGHGILYQPLAEWVDPTVRWALHPW